ncbi:MAG: HAMP domain-containing histidine kinase [Bacteroidaceae bacterium]|nr:HAMP domain-containing histidine kinase [Bacteroidaceae bacterium]
MPVQALASEEDANEFGIPQEIYLQYKHAYDNYTDKRLFAVSDSMLIQYQEQKEPIYLLLSYVLQHIYYYFEDDVDNFENTIKKGKELAQELNQTGLYYLLSATEITFNLYVTQLQFSALQQARELIAKAEETGNPTAMYLSTYALGCAYYLRCNWQKAHDSFQRAAEYIIHYGLTDRESALSSLYVMMGLCQYGQEHYAEALDCADKSIKYGNTNKLDVDFIRLSVYFYEDRKSEFWEALKEARQDLLTNSTVDYEYPVFFDVYEEMMNENYDEALKHAARFSDKSSRLEMEEAIYLRMKDYQNAYETSSRIRAYNDSVSFSLENADVDEINARLHTAELEREAIEEKTRNAHINYIFALAIMAIVVICMVVYAMNRRRNMRRMAAFNEALIMSQENERKAKIATDNALRRAESALSKAEQSERMKREFINNVSHEIRTPLNAISGFTQLILAPDFDMPPEEKEACGQQISENTEKLTKLINNILEISNLETGTTEIDRQLVNINGLIEECKSCYAEVKTINLELVDGKSVFVHSDVNRIKSILTKLIDNSIKFADDDPIVMGLSMEENPGRISIYVEDRGPGIPASMEFAIFERFKKIDEFSQGLGLGLSIAKAEAESLGGQLILDTKYTGGCRFVLILPKE